MNTNEGPEPRVEGQEDNAANHMTGTRRSRQSRQEEKTESNKLSERIN